MNQLKSFLSNTKVHVVVVLLFGLLTQYVTSNGWDTLTVGTIVHIIGEYIAA